MNIMAILCTNDGSHSLLSEQFGVMYHSHHGALAESRHVFVEAGLKPALAQKETVAVLEVGFGTGLNAFLTLLEADEQQKNVQYHGLEPYPVAPETAAQLNYSQLVARPERQADFMRLHEADWETTQEISPWFRFSKSRQPAETLQAEVQFDVIYHDAFAPQTQPELWSEATMARCYQALKPGGILVTFCVQGAFRRHLKAAGFEVEKLQGPPGKREMARAWRR
jgi:tRNA U34 5-methylaminomethyl-2-thiouridine-forming methyltransferase MnmC